MNRIISLFIALLSVLGILFFSAPVQASEKETAQSTRAPFSNEKRPAARFDHDQHVQTLGDAECALCHHVLDTETKKLIYSEGEEMACYECHSETKVDQVISFREANHASCTDCHRTLKRSDKAAGPTTCGECHKQ